MDIDLELYRRVVRISLDPLIRLSVIDIAPEESQQTYVFVHGFGGQAIQWRYQLANFSVTDRAIALDLRGHGLSDKPRSGYAMLDHLSDLERTLDHLGVSSPITLVGHSFGGAIATEFAVRQPKRISRLVLIASAGEFILNPLYRFLLKLPSSILQMATPFTRHWLGAPPLVMQAWYRDSLSAWNGWSLYRDLQVPTLVILGHMDVVFKKPMYEEVARLIPTAESVDVGASGHMVMLERREAVNRAIARFAGLEKRSWSDSTGSPDGMERTELIKKRPWLPYYDEGVPSIISIPNVPLQSLLRSAVRRFPRKTALNFEGFRMSYRRLNHEASRFANLLRALGVEKGDRVMLLLPNLPQLVISFYGTLKAGAVAVFTLPVSEPSELTRQLADSGASVLVTLNQNYELLRQIKSDLDSRSPADLKHVIFTELGDYLPIAKKIGLSLSNRRKRDKQIPIRKENWVHFFNRELYGQSRKSPDLEISPNDLAAIQYTGGTTDSPKGVMLTHFNLVANTVQTRHWMPEAQEGKEVFLCVVPFAHSYGLTAALNVPISIGALLVLKARFQVEDVLRTIQKHHPSIFPGVPQMYVAIKDFPGVRKYGVGSIKACLSGSAPLPVEVQEAFEKLTRGRLVEGYGLTEAGPVTHANPLAGIRKVGSIGIPVPSTEARVVDLVKGDTEVTVGQVGELAVRGPQVMAGYWHDTQSTKRVLRPDGWLLTGDVAQMDGEGYFRIIARKADMWYPSKPGKPAFPRDVEEVLFEIPQVKEAAVVAIARKPVAFIITRKDRPSAEALTSYCKRRLPPELVPRLVIFVDEFPRTFIGKVLRRELAKRYQENLYEPTKLSVDASGE